MENSPESTILLNKQNEDYLLKWKTSALSPPRAKLTSCLTSPATMDITWCFLICICKETHVSTFGHVPLVPSKGYLASVLSAVAVFGVLAGDSVHNMKFTLILIPALGPIVSFKFSLLCITCQNKWSEQAHPRPPRRPPSHRQPWKGAGLLRGLLV